MRGINHPRYVFRFCGSPINGRIFQKVKLLQKINKKLEVKNVGYNKKKAQLKYPYIEKKEGVCGGEPVIVRTRISVSLIVELERAGHSVDEMVTMYPHITHAQIYDALSYYFDHKKEIDKIINENKEEYWKEKTQSENWRR